LSGGSRKDWKEQLWPALRELGLFAALLPEEDGGYGGARTAALACRLIAYAGLTTPFAISSAAIARTFANRPQLSGKAAAVAQSLTEGEAVATAALHERDALPAVMQPQARLRHAASGGWTLDGVKRMVPFAAEADWLLIPVATDAGDLAAVLVEARPLAGAMRGYGLIDGTPAADLELSGHPVAEDEVIATGEAAVALFGELCDALSAA